MDNGLRGQYLEQLEAWNNARQFAAELVEAFCKNGIGDVLSRWKDTVSFPSRSEIKKLLNGVVFLGGHDTINQVARAVIEWEGWAKNPTPSMQSSSKQKVSV
jgi:hypothetical protein